MILPSLTLPLLLGAALPQAAADAPVKDQVLVHLRGRSEASYLLQVASDVDDHRGIGPDGSAVIYAGDAEQEHLRSLGFRLEVVHEDLTGFYAERARLDAAAARASAPGGSMGGFKTLAEISAEMDRLAAAYPNVVSSRFSLGNSLEGRPLWAMRVSDNPATHEPGEPTAWFDALHHAREPMSGEALLLYAELLAQGYGVDPAATRAVDSRNILIIPCVNPDGYEYNRQTAPNGGGLWRKNRRNNGGGAYGVDLNRNYDWEWGSQWPGSSGSPSSETYRGTAPFSEPETRVLRDQLNLTPPGCSASCHTYGNLWIFPWSYDTVYAPDDPVFRSYAASFAAAGWVYGTSWEVLYIANGVADDYHYGQHGAISYTPEIGSSSDGFWPAPSRIPALFQEVLPGLVSLTRWSGAWAEFTGQVWSELSGDGDPYREPGESWQLQLQARNDGVRALSAALLLSSPTPEVVITGAAATLNAAAHSSGLSTALTMSFAASAQSGAPYLLDLLLDYEGTAGSEPLVVQLGKARLLAHDDMEVADYGWTVNNALNYSWQRADPAQTSTGGQIAQPETDNPLGSGTRCWVTGAAAGSSAGSNDVDGVTVLTSPLFRAAAFASVELEYARWFANLPGSALDDRLKVELSGDGGATWTVLEETANANSWRTAAFQLEDYAALSDAMRLRFTAADQPNNDITEACIDDLLLRTWSSLPVLGEWGEVRLGAGVKVFLDGPEGRAYRVSYSFTKTAGTTVPGTAGTWYLGGSVHTLLQGGLDAQGQALILTTVPNQPALLGRTIHLQATVDQGGPEAAFSNLLSVTVS